MNNLRKIKQNLLYYIVIFFAMIEEKSNYDNKILWLKLRKNNIILLREQKYYAI